MTPKVTLRRALEDPELLGAALQDHLGMHGAPSCWQLWGNRLNPMN
jgi:hypothetical protein